MPGNTILNGRVVTVFVAILLVCGIGQVDLVSARDRYEPPAASTATPSAIPSSGDDTAPAGSAEDTSRVVAAPAVEEGALPQANVRARPDSRAYESPPIPTVVSTPTENPTNQIPRLDDPVLRWLPEILTSAKEAGVPAKLIAGVMRLESNGDPNIISPAGARGMMQIMPDGLYGMGIPQDDWHDPATNIRAGAFGLAQRAEVQGSWEGAVAAYFGFGCDIFGTCTEVYVSVVYSWAEYYADAIADPYSSGYAILGPDWSPPPVAPYVEASPPPVVTPPAKTPTPVASKTPTVTVTATPGAGETETPATEPTIEPTVAPTEVPTEEPTEIPTEAPTEVPTEEPTEAPVDPPVDTGTPPA